MPERTSRLTASALVVVGGAIAFGLGDIASAAKYTSGIAMGVGGLLMLIGGALFVFDWFTSWRDEQRGRNRSTPGFPVLPPIPSEAQQASH